MRRHKIKVFQVSFVDRIGDLHSFSMSHQNIGKSRLDKLWRHIGLRRVALAVQINQQGMKASDCQSRRQVAGGCCLADSAFLIGDRDYPHKNSQIAINSFKMRHNDASRRTTTERQQPLNIALSNQFSASVERILSNDL